jgi:hypothetical protein
MQFKFVSLWVLTPCSDLMRSQPRDHNLNLHHRENVRSRNDVVTVYILFLLCTLFFRVALYFQKLSASLVQRWIVIVAILSCRSQNTLKSLYSGFNTVILTAILQRREGEASTKVRQRVLCKLTTSAWFLDESSYNHYTVIKETGINMC